MQIRISRALCAGLIITLFTHAHQSLAQTAAQDSPSHIKVFDAVPDGFIELAAPQETIADVYVDNVLVGDVRITYKPTSIELKDADALVSKLENIVDAPAVRAALEGWQPSNPHLSCPKGQSCRLPKSDDVMIVFDENRFRIDLVIPERYLAEKPQQSQVLLPDSDATEPALLQTLDLAFTGNTDESPVYTLHGETLLGQKQQRITGSWVSTEETGLTFDELHYSLDHDGHETKVGLFEARDRNFSMLSNRNMLGIWWGNSPNLQNDKSIQKGTDIDLFLAAPGYVDIFKDGRLLDSSYYDAGNQTIDTSRLPDGAYNVTLKIRSGAGVEREEVHFFVKSGLLAPQGFPLYFMSLSQGRENNSDRVIPEQQGSEWEWRAGYSTRLTDSLGLDAGLITTNNESLVETGLFKAFPKADVQLKGLVGSRGDTGAQLISRWQLEDTAFQLDWRNISAHSSGSGMISNPEDYLIRDSIDQINFRLQHPFMGGRLAFQTQDSKRNNFDSAASSRLSFEKTKRISGTEQFTYFAEVGRQDNDWLTRVGIEWHFLDDRKETRLRTTHVSSENSFLENENYFESDASVVFKGRASVPGKNDTRFDVTTGNNSPRYRIQHDYDGALGSSMLSLQYEEKALEEKTTYAGRLSTRVISDGQYVATGSTSDHGDSAIVVDVKGHPSQKGEIRLIVDDQEKALVSVGEKAVLPLKAYQTYSIRFKPGGESFVAIDESEKAVTLYPGNVVAYELGAERLEILVGRLFNEHGAPLANKAIRGGHGLAATDEEGYFQLESYSGTELLRSDTDQGECLITLPRDQAYGSIRRLGSVVCKEVAEL